MQILYPEIKPYTQHAIKMDDTHTIYVEECGDPDGIPVLFVHGGPGAGANHNDRRFFDPEKFRIIIFDQRGSGRSTPHASLENNTSSDLINDMETIRKKLMVEKWMLFGGSWGATLSLLYAQAHPDKVTGMVLRGTFLCREQDLTWFYRSGADAIFPDYWQEFIKPIAENERNDLIHAYHKRLNGDNELAKMAAAKAWSLWEGQCATLRPSTDVIEHFSDPHLAVSLARIETHYFMNQGFIEPNQIINNAEKLEGIPSIIIHGRYDMVCPLDNAFELYNAWPDSELQIIRDAGHSSHEPSIIDALIKATNAMALIINGEGDHLS